MMLGLAMMATALTMQSFIANDDTMTKENGMFVINTTSLAKDVEGYNGPTPLKIYIKKNKVERIEFLKSLETPKYYAKVKKALMDKWNGLKVKDAQKHQVAFADFPMQYMTDLHRCLAHPRHNRAHHATSRFLICPTVPPKHPLQDLH